MSNDWLWQSPDWPRLHVDNAALAQPMATARLAQGRLLGKSEALGRLGALPAEQLVWAGEAVATAAIEGEKLDPVAVHSSVARRLALAGPAVAVPPAVEGLLDVMQDAAESWARPLDKDRLCRWQAALFPTGQSGLQTITVGAFRSGAAPMQIVSGPQGREVVHFEAVPSAVVDAETRAFLEWFEATRGNDTLDGLVRAALAHLWFETIHPFDDGNGRIGRALVDLAVAQDVRAPWRLHGLSRRLLKERDPYYDALNAAQRGDTDVTTWVAWFLRTFEAACRDSLEVVDEAVERAQYWARFREVALSDAQRKALARMLDAGRGKFEGGMTPRKFIALTGLSRATATRELTDLAAKGLLVQVGAGRSTRYELPMPGWQWQGAARGAANKQAEAGS
jgi:Fic family protein